MADEIDTILSLMSQAMPEHGPDVPFGVKLANAGVRMSDNVEDRRGDNVVFRRLSPYQDPYDTAPVRNMPVRPADASNILAAFSKQNAGNPIYYGGFDPNYSYQDERFNNFNGARR